MIGKPKKDWKKPTMAQIKANKRHIEEFEMVEAVVLETDNTDTSVDEA